MKTFLKFSALIFVMVIFSGISPKQVSAQQGPVDFQVFYDELSPYGQWADFRSFGYVWFPDAGPGFAPYSSEGRWLLSDYGWTWISYYDWGWAPFHYGRWDYDNFYGWFWVPDNVWGPSWVNWRRADGYYGWSPMGPGFNTGFGSNYDNYNGYWVFVRDRYIGRYNLDRYYVDRDEYDWIYSNSAMINNTYFDQNRNTTYVTGPTRADVQRDTGRKMRSYAVQEYDEPGQDVRNGSVRIYRPEVVSNRESERQSAPSRITDLNEIRRSSENNSATQLRSVTPYDMNRSEPQPDIMNPQNRNNNALPLKEQNINSGNNANRIDRTAAENPLKSKEVAQPVNPQQETPYGNNRDEHQPDIMNPQNRNNNAQPLKSQIEIQSENRRDRLQNAENRQNNTSVKSQPTQVRTVNPPDNKRRER